MAQNANDKGPALAARSPEGEKWSARSVDSPRLQAAQVLPLVAAARERDRIARERLAKGKAVEPEQQADFAAKIRTTELAAGRRGRRS